MNKISYLRNFKELTSGRSENYYFFRGFLWCLDPKETCKTLDLKFNQDKFKTHLIFQKIFKDVKIKLLHEHICLFNKLLENINKLNNYYKKERCAKYLAGMSILLPGSYRRRLINIFLKSKYRNNRNRAYNILSEIRHKNYKKILINSWRKKKDVEALKKFIKNFPQKALEKEDLDLLIERWYKVDDPEALEIIIEKIPFKMFRKQDIRLLVDALKNEDIKYHGFAFEVKILRNNLYSKLYKKILKYFPESITSLKATDPISYIYILKECDQRISSHYAINTFKNYPTSRRYLLFWFGQMKLWSLIKRIKNTPSLKSENPNYM